MYQTNIKKNREEMTFTRAEQVTGTHLSQLPLQHKEKRLEKLMHVHYSKSVMQK